MESNTAMGDTRLYGVEIPNTDEAREELEELVNQMDEAEIVLTE